MSPWVSVVDGQCNDTKSDSDTSSSIEPNDVAFNPFRLSLSMFVLFEWCHTDWGPQML